MTINPGDDGPMADGTGDRTEQFRSSPPLPPPSFGGDQNRLYSSPATTPAPRPILFAVEPWHALAALSGVSVLLAIIADSTVSWLLTAVAAGVGSWFAFNKGTQWPSEIRDILVSRRLATPSEGPPAPPPAEGASTRAVQAPIPFRAMTISEMFAGTGKVLLKTWPVLVGIPVAILCVFLLGIFLLISIVSFFTFNDSSSLSGGLLSMTSSSLTGMFVMLGVFYLAFMAVASIGDALLLAMSVNATDRAVRGQEVKIGQVWIEARGRMFAVWRMTLTFYALSFLPSSVFTALLFAGAGLSSLFVIPIIFAVVFAVSVLVSLSPIVLVLENRGVADSMKRSISLSKPAWGRIIGIHLLWSACAVPAAFLMLFLGNVILYAFVFGALIAGFRVLQVLIYIDLRIRQEQYESGLIEDWSRNTGHRST